jgi:competence protein ComGC
MYCDIAKESNHTAGETIVVVIVVLLLLLLLLDLPSLNFHERL